MRPVQYSFVYPCCVGEITDQQIERDMTDPPINYAAFRKVYTQSF